MGSREHAGNLSGNERTWSLVIGAALPLLLVRRGSPILSTLAAAAGIGLLARAATGSCAVKAAIKSGLEGSAERESATSGGQGGDGERKPLDAQDSVEEYAEPVAVQEGRASNAPASSSSAAMGR